MLGSALSSQKSQQVFIVWPFFTYFAPSLLPREWQRNEGPGADGEAGLCEPHEVQRGPVRGAAPGPGTPGVSTGGGAGLESSPAEEGFGVLG